MQRGFAFGLCGVLSACSGSTQTSNVSVVEPPAPQQSDAGATKTATPRDEAAPRGRLYGYQVDDDSPKLGQPCKPKPEEDGMPSCGASGLITAVRANSPISARTPVEAAPPCELLAIGGRDLMEVYQTSACMEHNTLLLVSHCIACRMPDTGSSMLLQLDDLTPEQWTALRHTSGLAERTPKSTEAWRELVQRSRR